MTDGNGSRRLSRRTALKLGAGTAAASTLGGLAGCSSLPIIGGGGGSSMRDWLVEPGEIRDRDTYEATYRDFAAIADHEDDLADDVYDPVAETFDSRYGSLLDIEMGEADWELLLGGRRTTAFSGPYNRSAVVEALEGLGFDREDGRVNGFTLLTADARGVALDGSTVLAVRAVPDPAGALETFVGVKSGGADLFPEENDAVAAVLDAVDGDHVTLSEQGPTDAVEAVAVSATLDGETTARTAALAFDDEGDVDEELLGEIEEGTEWDDIETSTDGRLGIVEGEQDTDAFAFGGIGRRGDPATVARQWLRAANQGDEERVRELTHSQGEIQGRLSIIITLYEQTELTIEGVETTEVDGDRARVEATVTNEEQGETSSAVIELRIENGRWRVWGFPNAG